MNFYTYARKTSYSDIGTNYISIAAVSQKQARFFFDKFFGKQEYVELVSVKPITSIDKKLYKNKYLTELKIGDMQQANY